MIIKIIGQGFGIIGIILNAITFQEKEQKRICFWQFCGSICFMLNFFMLGAVIGGMLNGLGMIRALVYMFYEKTHANHPLWFIGFILAYLTSYILSFTVFNIEPTPINFVIEILPVIAMTALSIGYTLNNSKSFRLSAYVSSPCWLVYNIIYLSIGAIITEAINIISITIGTFRHDIKKNNLTDSSEQTI